MPLIAPLPVTRLAALCAVLMAVSSQAEGRTRLMVMNLTASERDLQPLADSLSESVLTELQRSPNLEVVGQSDVASMLGLERQRQLLGCVETSCMTELSGALGVPWLVTGSVARLGKAYRIDLKLLQASNGTATWRDGKTTRGDAEVFEVLTTMVKDLVRTFGQPGPSRVGAGPLVLLIGGAAVAVAGAVFTGLAASEWGPLNDVAWRASHSWVEVQQTGSAFNRNIVLGPILLGTGLAAAAGGLVWWLTGRTAAVAVIPLPGALALSGTW